MLTMIMVFMSLMGVEVPEEKSKPEIPVNTVQVPDYSYVTIFGNMDNIRY